ncbi:MAG: hypothetical protein VXZ31_08505, partial [Pseudomonadota bacterium]|nr:hypothetical protein [Pseudomonadota bacterium]
MLGCSPQTRDLLADRYDALRLTGISSERTPMMTRENSMTTLATGDDDQIKSSMRKVALTALAG